MLSWFVPPPRPRFGCSSSGCPAVPRVLQRCRAWAPDQGSPEPRCQRQIWWLMQRYLGAGLEPPCSQGSAGQEEVKPVFAVWHLVPVPPMRLERVRFRFGGGWTQSVPLGGLQWLLLLSRHLGCSSQGQGMALFCSVPRAWGLGLCLQIVVLLQSQIINAVCEPLFALLKKKIVMSSGKLPAVRWQHAPSMSLWLRSKVSFWGGNGGDVYRWGWQVHL